MIDLREFKALQRRLEAIEAESAARRVMARYFQLCDRLGSDTPMDELAQLFTRDATWEGKGRYRDALGRHDGRDAIVAMLSAYAGPIPHFAMNAHFLGSENIRPSGSGATGEWMMLQTSAYADGRSDLRGAALTVRFAREDGVWRIAHFQTESLFSRSVSHWSDDTAIPVPASPCRGG